ncbi:MAG: IS66 family insertion sequence element accessory protein TnpB [Verrucomicrobia bacterium]|nr:IS66 family insertion sequence element accessory protein TnpB [Verrucomicrobiota bacterium]
MWAINATTRIYLAVGTTDMRLGFNGLSALVEHQLKQSPVSGYLFAFCNRRRNRMKLLFWDGSGLWHCVRDRPARLLRVGRGPPQNRTSPIKASGSSHDGFAPKAIYSLMLNPSSSSGLDDVATSNPINRCPPSLITGFPGSVSPLSTLL